MKPITFLLLLSLLNCFTVYKKDETVLEKETLETKDVKGEFDLSEQAMGDQKITSIILKYNKTKESAKCNAQYPKIATINENLYQYEINSLKREYCGGIGIPGTVTYKCS